jgi:hypothetical protein
MFKKISVAALLCLASLGCMAQKSHATENIIKKDFVLKGDTIWVRISDIKYRYDWTTPLREELNNFKEPSNIRKVIFVNMTDSGHWERIGSEVIVQKWLRAAGATTVIVGGCDNYCARFFAGGVKRQLAQGAYINLRPPVDYDTKQIYIKFPDYQFAAFERENATPGVIPHKPIFIEAFTQGGETGGTHFSLEQVQFCKARNPDAGCKVYDGLDAYKVGLVTDPNPVEVELPDGW